MGERVVSDGKPPIETDEASSYYGWYKMSCVLCKAVVYLDPWKPWCLAICLGCLGDKEET